MEPSNTDILDVSVTLRWNEPMDIDIASYRIEYRVKVDQSEWTVVIVDPPMTSHVITGLSPLTTYEVRIFAISVDDVSSVAADPLSVTTRGTRIVYTYVNTYIHHVPYHNSRNLWNKAVNILSLCQLMKMLTVTGFWKRGHFVTSYSRIKCEKISKITSIYAF